MAETIISSHAGYNAKSGFVNGYLARPAVSERRPGVVLLSAMWGLNWTQKELTRAFARAGFVALSPDLLHGQLPKERASALLAKTSVDIDEAVDIAAAATRYLRKLPWVGRDGRIGVVGFCLGGGLALLAAARTRAFQAAVIYHHSLFPDPQELRGISCNILGHYGTADDTTPREEVEAFKKTLERYGKKHEIVFYQGMGHGFVDSPLLKDSPERRKAATESLNRTYKFFRRELSTKPPPRNAAPRQTKKRMKRATAQKVGV
ncbi:MAG: dienelactone hydrolase family protein [Deltaproteobacteria bacterium]